jgi:hypothetical protein
MVSCGATNTQISHSTKPFTLIGRHMFMLDSITETSLRFNFGKKPSRDEKSPHFFFHSPQVTSMKEFVGENELLEILFNIGEKEDQKVTTKLKRLQTKKEIHLKELQVKNASKITKKLKLKKVKSDLSTKVDKVKVEVVKDEGKKRVSFA